MADLKNSIEREYTLKLAWWLTLRDRMGANQVVLLLTELGCASRLFLCRCFSFFEVTEVRLTANHKQRSVLRHGLIDYSVKVVSELDTVFF